MCRLLYLPESLSKAVDSSDMMDFLRFLEKSQGGDGNGFFYFKGDLTFKSVDIPIETMYTPLKPFLFHTRKATHGAIDDINCHPIVGKRYAVIHNGIFSDNELAPLFDIDRTQFSDSYLIHRLLEEFGFLRFFKTFKNYGVIIVYNIHNKKTFLLKSTGVLRGLETEEGWLYASEVKNGGSASFFPNLHAIAVHTFGSGLWEIGEDGYRLIENPPPYTSNYGRSNYSRSGYSNKTYTVTKVPPKKKKKKKKGKNKKKQKFLPNKNGGDLVGLFERWCPQCGNELSTDYNENFMSVRCGLCNYYFTKKYDDIDRAKYAPFETLFPPKEDIDESNEEEISGLAALFEERKRCPHCEAYLIINTYRDIEYLYCENCDYYYKEEDCEDAN